jgi:glycosyltransferase involved in cell wall biosynthesis
MQRGDPVKLAICTPLRITDGDRLRNWNTVYRETCAACDRIGAEWIVAEGGGQYANRPGVIHVPVAHFNRARARNLAWRATDADLICFLDADVVMRPEAWPAAIAAAEKLDCYTPSSSLLKLGPTQTRNRCTDQGFVFNAYGVARFRGNLFGAISFCRRSFLQEVGGWDERFKGWGYEDTALEWLANSGGYRIGWDDHDVFHLYHGRGQRKGKQSTHALYLRDYNNRSFEEALRRRGVDPPPYKDIDLLAKPISPPSVRTIDSFFALTSLSPKPFHIERQHVTLTSWRDFGLRIHSVNSADEISQLKPLFPQVERWWHTDQLSREFDHPTIRITAMTDIIQQVDRPMLMINSDIEIRGKQSQLLDAITPGLATVGVRFNYDHDFRQSSRERWGLDAFYLEPQHVRDLPELPFAIGKPVWDYWIPLHLALNGFESSYIGEPLFFHKSHRLNWSKRENAMARTWLSDHYGRIDTGRLRMRLPFPP